MGSYCSILGYENGINSDNSNNIYGTSNTYNNDSRKRGGAQNNPDAALNVLLRGAKKSLIIPCSPAVPHLGMKPDNSPPKCYIPLSSFYACRDLQRG